MVEKSHIAGGLGTDWWPSIYAPLGRVGQKLAVWLAPRADAAAIEDCYEINVELPGVVIENVDVSIDENMLMVKGEKHHAHDMVGRSYFFSEREYGTFQRSFRLPTDAQADKIIVYNFCYERPYTIEDICDTYARVGELRKPKVVIPLRVMIWLASTALSLDHVGLHNEFHPERILKLFRSTHIVPEGLRKAGFHFETDLEEALRDTDIGL